MKKRVARIFYKMDDLGGVVGEYSNGRKKCEFVPSSGVIISDTTQSI